MAMRVHMLLEKEGSYELPRGTACNSEDDLLDTDLPQPVEHIRGRVKIGGFTTVANLLVAHWSPASRVVLIDDDELVRHIRSGE